VKWYGIIAFLILFGGLAGIVILGFNPEKTGIDFGKPSSISQSQTELQAETPSIETTLPVKEITYRECRADYISKYCLFHDDSRKGECLIQVAKNAESVCEKYR